MQKTVQKQRSKKDRQEEAPAPARDEQAQKVSADADDMLAELDCCLAENEADAEKALKAQGKAEYEALDDVYEKEGYEAYSRLQQVWMAKYAHLFDFCCGVPDFDDE